MQITLDSCLRRNDKQALRLNFGPGTDFLRFFSGETGAAQRGVFHQLLTVFMILALFYTIDLQMSTKKFMGRYDENC